MHGDCTVGTPHYFRTDSLTLSHRLTGQLVCHCLTRDNSDCVTVSVCECQYVNVSEYV
jgi:hypothetical protein